MGGLLDALHSLLNLLTLDTTHMQQRRLEEEEVSSAVISARAAAGRHSDLGKRGYDYGAEVRSEDTPIAAEILGLDLPVADRHSSYVPDAAARLFWDPEHPERMVIVGDDESTLTSTGPGVSADDLSRRYRDGERDAARA